MKRPIESWLFFFVWHMLTEKRLYDQRNEERYQSKLKRLRNMTE